MTQRVGTLPVLPSRDAYEEYLSGFPPDGYPGSAARRRPLTKSFILETVSETSSQPSLDTIVAGAGLRLSWTSGDFARIVDADGEVLGVLDHDNRRFPILHTQLDARLADAAVNRLITSTPWLDRAWLPTAFFDGLWDHVRTTVPAHRMTRLTFRYEAAFEAAGPGLVGAPEDDETDDDLDDDNVTDESERPVVERPRSKFVMADRVSAVARDLSALRKAYRPLNSLVQLRMPSSGPGGHEVYYTGKVTDWSGSFPEQVALLRFIVSSYQRLTEGAENAFNDDGRAASAVLIRFSAPLGQQTFDKWVAGFTHKRSRFRIAGQPIRLGPTKVHLYGIDRHVNHPLDIEATARQMVVYVPDGTCGNSINRLISNIQRFLDPGVMAWIGNTPYETLVRHAMRGTGGS